MKSLQIRKRELGWDDRREFKLALRAFGVITDGRSGYHTHKKTDIAQKRDTDPEIFYKYLEWSMGRGLWESMLLIQSATSPSAGIKDLSK